MNLPEDLSLLEEWRREAQARRRERLFAALLYTLIFVVLLDIFWGVFP